MKAGQSRQQYSNARSTKTRIETEKAYTGLNPHFDSNARSTKTRIETPYQDSQEYTLYLIRMQDPLKQGLKHCFIIVCGSVIFIRMQDPLKQGLKLFPALKLQKTLSDSNARSTKTRIET